MVTRNTDSAHENFNFVAPLSFPARGKFVRPFAGNISFVYRVAVMVALPLSAYKDSGESRARQIGRACRQAVKHAGAPEVDSRSEIYP